MAQYSQELIEKHEAVFSTVIDRTNQLISELRSALTERAEDLPEKLLALLPTVPTVIVPRVEHVVIQLLNERYAPSQTLDYAGVRYLVETRCAELDRKWPAYKPRIVTEIFHALAGSSPQETVWSGLATIERLRKEDAAIRWWIGGHLHPYASPGFSPKPHEEPTRQFSDITDPFVRLVLEAHKDQARRVLGAPYLSASVRPETDAQFEEQWNASVVWRTPEWVSQYYRSQL